jgi:hypothetical protein
LGRSTHDTAMADEKADPTTGVTTPEHDFDASGNVILPTGWIYKTVKLGKKKIWVSPMAVVEQTSSLQHELT